MSRQRVRVLFVGAADPLREIESRLRPLWPCYLAAYAEQHLDPGSVTFRLAKTALDAELREFKPHLVGISSVSQNYNQYAVPYAALAKRHGAVVVVGGMHITSVPSCLTKDMDVGCLGEGEVTFVELLRLYLATGGLTVESLIAVKGIVFRDGDRLVRTPGRVAAPPLDVLPHPKRSLIGYARRGYLYSARGCAYKCVFCACTQHWGTVRYAPSEFVLEEVRELVANGVRVIRFNDENFIGNRKRFLAIAELIVSEGINKKVRFSCWCRSNNVTVEVAKALKAMNVVSVKMGLESGCDRTLAYLKGGVTVEDNRNAVRLLKDEGIQVNGDFIIGAPFDTESEILETYDFIKNSRLDFVDVNILTPFPGTRIWDYALERGLVSSEMDWNSLNFKFNRNARTAVVLSETLSYEQLAALNKKFQRLRAMKFIKALPRTPWLSEIPLLVARRVREMLPHHVPSGNG